MIKVKTIGIFLFLSLQCLNTNAMDEQEQLFVSGCSALVDMYTSIDEKSEFAAVFTSVADSFQAGYCRGVLEILGERCNKDWHELAVFVSTQEPVLHHYDSLKTLFNTACN